MQGDKMNRFIEPKPKTTTVKLKIGIAYSFLSIINISIFSNLIFENQIDLIINNFKLHYSNFASVASKDLSSLEFIGTESEDFNSIKQALHLNGVTKFLIYNQNNSLVYTFDEFNEFNLIDQIKSYIILLKEKNTNNFKKFFIDLNPNDYKVKILFFVKANDITTLTIYTEETIRIVEDRMRQLYIQIGLVVVLGILLHLLFAIYLYKLIFTRLNILKLASNHLKSGNLSFRADWDRKSNDELDDLGSTFNSMADSLQNNITTISKLNHEIQIELEIGKEVQSFFLPKMEIFHDKNIAVEYYPMREVSGDLYNFYKFKDGSRAIFFADAMGHGVPAALVTTVINLGLQIILRKTNKPSQVITRINSYVSHYLKCSYFASAVFILLPQDGNKIIFSNAAQNDPILFKKNQIDFEHLSSDGLNLGMIDNYTYPERELQYESGDKLFIYSDGITEAKSGNEQFGNERLNKLIQTNFMDSNKIITEKLISDVKTFTNNYFDDDVTCILLNL